MKVTHRRPPRQVRDAFAVACWVLMICGLACLIVSVTLFVVEPVILFDVYRPLFWLACGCLLVQAVLGSEVYRHDRPRAVAGPAARAAALGDDHRWGAGARARMTPVGTAWGLLWCGLVCFLVGSTMLAAGVDGWWAIPTGLGIASLWGAWFVASRP